MARVPSINSLQSIFNGMFRPLCVGELAAAVQRIARRCSTISSSVTIDSKISSINWGSDTLAFPLHEANLTASMIPHAEDANKLPLKLVPMRFVQVNILFKRSTPILICRQLRRTTSTHQNSEYEITAVAVL